MIRIFRRTVGAIQPDATPPPRESIYNADGDVIHPCPACGAKVLDYPTCHTYEQHGKWVACISCDSATDLYCSSDDCDWSYTWGLNPRSPGSVRNEESRPSWLVGAGPHAR